MNWQKISFLILDADLNVMLHSFLLHGWVDMNVWDRFFLFHSYSARQLDTKLRSLDRRFSLQKKKFCLLSALTFCPASYSPRPIREVLIGSPRGWMLLALWLGIELACWLGIEGVKTDERIWLSFLLQTSLFTLTLKESRAGRHTHRHFCSA